MDDDGEASTRSPRPFWTNRGSRALLRDLARAQVSASSTWRPLCAAVAVIDYSSDRSAAQESRVRWVPGAIRPQSWWQAGSLR